MKKIIFAGLAAICMMAVSQQHASAWVNARFGVGLNYQLQSGGNNLLWGGFKNGQPPGPEGFGGGMQPNFSPPMPQGYGYAPMPQAYPAQTEPAYAGQYNSPYQFANYARPIYYYPAPAYYYYAR